LLDVVKMLYSIVKVIHCSALASIVEILPEIVKIL